MRESRTYGFGRGACHEMHVPTATRREFITLLGGAAAAWPLAARAQRSERTARIGFLYPGPLAVAPPRIEIVLSGLRSAGRQGEQVELVPRVADSDPARLPRLAAELIEEKVDVVVAVSTAAVRAVQAASTTIPIVAHDLETDPVAMGSSPTMPARWQDHGRLL